MSRNYKGVTKSLHNPIGQCDLQTQIQRREEDIPDDILELQNKTNLILLYFQTEFLQKRKNVNFYQETSFCFQKQKFLLDEESEQFNNSKLFYGPDSINSLKTQQNQSHDFTNMKFDKVDALSQNEIQRSVMTKIQTSVNKAESPIKRKSFSKQTELSKNCNVKTGQQDQEKHKIKKSFSEIISDKLKVMRHSSMKSAIQKTIFKFRKYIKIQINAAKRNNFFEENNCYDDQLGLNSCYLTNRSNRQLYKSRFRK
ncbi:hypothetical protein ABPG72_002625 [Tetrahymena utriculariae]